MTRVRSLADRLLRNPAEAHFGEVAILLRSHGFEEVRSKGSHHVFRDSHGRMIVIPRVSGRRVKRTYVRRVLTLLGLDGHREDGNQEDQGDAHED